MNEQIITNVSITIARYMGFDVTPSVAFAIGRCKYDTDYNAIMPVVDKIEAETGYLMVSGPFLDGETGKLSGEYFCQFIYQTTNLNMDAYIDKTGCSSRLEAIFLGVGEFLDKYYSQEEKNRRIKEKQTKIRLMLDSCLNHVWEVVNCKIPSNHNEIIKSMLNDICLIAQPENWDDWSESDFPVTFKRWIEAQVVYHPND